MSAAKRNSNYMQLPLEGNSNNPNVNSTYVWQCSAFDCLEKDGSLSQV